jgi:hypothetical protein
MEEFLEQTVLSLSRLVVCLIVLSTFFEQPNASLVMFLDKNSFNRRFQRIVLWGMADAS